MGNRAPDWSLDFQVCSDLLTSESHCRSTVIIQFLDVFLLWGPSHTQRQTHAPPCQPLPCPCPLALYSIINKHPFGVQTEPTGGLVQGLWTDRQGDSQGHRGFHSPSCACGSERHFVRMFLNITPESCMRSWERTGESDFPSKTPCRVRACVSSC